MGDEKTIELSKEQAEKARAWIDKKAPGLRCSVCGHSDFVLAPHLVTPTVTKGAGALIFAPTNYPQVMVICANCANTYYFNAVRMGLVPKEPPEQKEPELAQAEPPSDG